MPIDDHGDLDVPDDRASALSILHAQDVNRLQDLVPIRYGRMLATPFTFLRGSAAVMAADLAAGPRTDITVQLCGDAHLSNFGMFSSPERRLVFVGTAAAMNPLDLFYYRLDVEELASTLATAKSDRRRLAKTRKKSARKNSLGALGKLTDIVDGRRVIVSNPPTSVSSGTARPRPTSRP